MIEIQPTIKPIMEWYGDPLPLTWKRGGLHVYVACANGHWAMLDHDIAEDGIITPSVVCPAEGCDSHVMAKLEGWTP